MRYSFQPRKRKYSKGYTFSSFARKIDYKYGKKINGYCNRKHE